MAVVRYFQFHLRSLRKYIALTLLGITTSWVIAACSNGGGPTSATGGGPTSATASNPVKLTLVSYAVTQSAYKEIIPQFVQEWKKKTGQEVVFDQSYGGSGSQTRAVIDGLEADVVALALALDVNKIEKAGIIKPGWEQRLPNNSIVTKSVSAFALRNKRVKVSNWSDLAPKGIKVITANPKTSGGARWNFLGLWGSVTQLGGSQQEAQNFIEKVFRNVPVMPKDSREASDVFYKEGQGDVLINYENELLLAKSQGNSQPFVVPTNINISIDNPVALVDTYVDKHGTREVAEAFAKFLFTPQAQRKFVNTGYRPVNETVAKEFENKYPKIKKLFTAQELGGWNVIQRKFFADGAIFDQIEAEIAKSR
ncbi:MAG: sulfate ABC transporter substrate-binding protein [Chroococcidiopsidaceae cyanobacterium CP_BM_RX_35]|nr:sulfate ABC transporter substrate-binding protein [Chroococcidiopsidaceae cyanobacterium CP_BM_RX_35]